MRRFFYGMLSLMLSLTFVSVLMAQEYAGSETCKTCHGDIYDTFIKTGHPHKITKINGAAPVFPEGTSPGVPNPPSDMTWNDVSYIIGGFGWKARFMDLEGYILTGDSIRQYNLAKSHLGLDAHWIGYDPKEAPRKPSVGWPPEKTGLIRIACLVFTALGPNLACAVKPAMVPPKTTLWIRKTSNHRKQKIAPTATFGAM